MKKFIAAVLMTLASSAFAQTDAKSITSIDVRTLTPEQRAQLLASVTQMKQEPGIAVSEKLRTEASKWGELGENLGKATVAAAKEVGVAANDFVGTPLGKVVTAIVIYKVVGHDIIRVVIGLALLTFFFSVGLWFLLRKQYESVTYQNVPVLFGLWNRKVIVEYRLGDMDVRVLLAAVCAVAGLATGLPNIL